MAAKRAIDFLQLAVSDNMIDFSPTGGRKKYELLIKTGTTKVLLDYRTITFAQGLKDYTILHTVEKKYVVKGSVKNLEDFLPGDFFIRVHKSFIVARNKIKLLHRNKIEFDQVSIPVGRNYKSGVEEYLQSASSGKTW
jgi:DNA-binding LytR/AlgR family response regulator